MEIQPLILSPASNFYCDPVIVLDFQSLYPSMVIAYNICYSTCLGKLQPGEDAAGQGADGSDSIWVTPNRVRFVAPSVRRGVLPHLLREILQTRILVKQTMKHQDVRANTALHRELNAKQYSLKLIANVTYGYTAAGYSGRMPSPDVADSIVQMGRSTLQRAIKMVEADPKWGAKVVYGDTDSIFVLLKGRSREQAFEIGAEIAKRVTAANPTPVRLMMEKVYQV